MNQCNWIFSVFFIFKFSIVKTVHPIFQRIFRNILNVVTVPCMYIVYIWNPTLPTYLFQSGQTTKLVTFPSKTQTWLKVCRQKVTKYKVRCLSVDNIFYGICCSITLNIHERNKWMKKFIRMSQTQRWNTLTLYFRK